MVEGSPTACPALPTTPGALRNQRSTPGSPPPSRRSLLYQPTSPTPTTAVSYLDLEEGVRGVARGPEALAGRPRCYRSGPWQWPLFQVVPPPSCPQVGRHGYSCKVAPKHSSVVGKPDKDATKKEPKLTPRESSEEEPPSLFLHRLARVPKARYISEKVASPPRGSFWKQQAGALSSLPLLTDSRKRKGGDSSVVL